MAMAKNFIPVSDRSELLLATQARRACRATRGSPAGAGSYLILTVERRELKAER